MAFNIISAAEAATYIKHGYNVGLSGFTPAGSPKAVTPEIAKMAIAEHEAGLSKSVSSLVPLPAILPMANSFAPKPSVIVLLTPPTQTSAKQ